MHRDYAGSELRLFYFEAVFLDNGICQQFAAHLVDLSSGSLVSFSAIFTSMYLPAQTSCMDVKPRLCRAPFMVKPCGSFTVGFSVI